MLNRYSVLSLLVAVATTSVSAQQSNPLAAADSALQSCAAAVERKEEKLAKAEADRAISLYRAAENRKETAADALAGHARVIGSCRMPFVSLMSKGALSEQSIDLANRAIAIDPMHFGAHVMLAFNYHGTPSFLGKTDDAIRELEWLVKHYGERTDARVMGTVYAYLGDMYKRQNNDDKALATWRKGASLFPNDPELKSRLATVLKVPAPAPAPPTSSSSSEAPIALRPLVVESGSYSVDDPRTATALKRLDVYTAPGGTADVLQVFQMMPGTTRATDGSDLYVRGGDPAESPVFLDGARLFHAGTFESLSGSVFGVLDPSVMKNAYFSAGGFSARYGNALSGVLDVETEGRPEVFRWRAGANLATASATVFAPIGETSGAFVSTSATMTNALLSLHGRSSEYTRAPRAGQMLGSYTFQPRAGTELRMVGLTEADRMSFVVDNYGYNGVLEANGATRMAGLTGRWMDGAGKRSVRSSLSFSQRATDFRFGAVDRDRDDRSLSLRVEGDYAAIDRVRLRAGSEIALFSMAEKGTTPSTSDLTPGAPTEELDRSENTEHVGAFIETELRLLPELALVAGVRADQLPGSSSATMDPRAGIAWRTGDWTLRAGGGIYSQGPWRVRYRVPDGGAPSGIPTRARHFALGAQRDGDTPIRVEAFSKTYSDYVADGVGPQVVSGRSRGVDAIVRYSSLERVSGWVSYSLLDASVELANGERVRANTDVTHTLTGVAKTSLSDSWDLGTTLRYGTGRPISEIAGATPIENGRGFEPVYGAINADRLPRYVRLDARLMHLRPVGDNLLVFYIEGLNLMNHANVLAYSYDRTYRSRRGVESFFSERTLVLGVEASF